MDLAESARWLRKAAEQGEVQAQISLGTMYSKGVGVQKDSAEAVRWYRKAADQGNSVAQHNLAILYISGDGVRQDFITAYMWASLAALTDENAKPLLDRMDTNLSQAQIAEGKRLTREWLAKHR
jgi:TPR repeat protein